MKGKRCGNSRSIIFLTPAELGLQQRGIDGDDNVVNAIREGTACEVSSQLSPLLGRSLLLMLQLAEASLRDAPPCFAAKLLAVPVSHRRHRRTSKTSFLRRRLSIVQRVALIPQKAPSQLNSSFASFSTFCFSRLSQHSFSKRRWKCQSITKLLKAAQSVNHSVAVSPCSHGSYD